jgi:hypothetical protein
MFDNLLQWIEWLCKKIGVRFLWHLPLKTGEFSTPELPPKDLLLPDFSKTNEDMSSESFKHRFLNANRSWIIEQLRGALGRPDADGMCCLLMTNRIFVRFAIDTFGQNDCMIKLDVLTLYVCRWTSWSRRNARSS